MKRLVSVFALLSALGLAACGPQPVARIPKSGVSGASGGGELELNDTPLGTTQIRGGYGY